MLPMKDKCQRENTAIVRDLESQKENEPDWEIIWQTTNLPSLPGHLHLFFRVSILLELINVWNNVEGQWMGKYFVLCHGSFPIEN